LFPVKADAGAGDIRARFKLWLSAGAQDGAFGGGKWRLFEAIERTGSLRAAADALEISYRKAWGDLRKAEKALNLQFLDRRRGGSDGGETRLTDMGRKWLAEYGRFQARVQKAVEKEFQTWKERTR
jgi:molybdate transport system regulatory protein